MSQTPQKLGQKMCKSPKNSTNSYQIKPEKIDYENLSTNCTVVGSNNLNLVKKPQIVTNMSPAYSNPSPGYPPSPYSSPASLKSPSPNLKPPTPQPSFPVMQIINSHSLLARPIQTNQSQNIIKLKPHLNILPKPSASPQPSPKPSVSPQIVIPTNQPTIMPTAQPVLLNQMPLLTTPGVQFILRPQTAKIPAAAPQGLILQPSGQPLLQIPRSQPMVRVLTNGVQLAPSTTTTAYVTTQMTNPQPPTTPQNVTVNNQVKKKPKNKVKKKLDLANLMKISGIGDEDDIQFESDASQSESEPNSVPNTPQETKKIGNIQLSAMPQTATPVVQVLNQNFQSGMISNSNTQPQASIPFNPFLTPNFTINNGLMVQRSGGFKLTMGEDGRLVLQHDPTLNQDLQSQLILQSIFGLNGGLVLQPSMDQQTVQQTVQTIQQQSVQTIQQQTVQSQTIQTVQQQQHTLQPQIQQQTVQQTIQHQTVQSQPLMQQPMQIVQPHSLHSLQSQIQGQLQNLLQQQQQQQNQAVQTHQVPPQSPTFQQQQQQNQPVLKVQPFQKAQPPVQTVHPQPQPQQENQQQQQQQPPPTSYVVNLTPEQLEQLKRNGQLTVNGQTIFMQRPNNSKQDECKKLSPKIKPVKKVQQPQQQPKQQIVKNFEEPIKEKETKSSLINALQSPPKHISPPQKQAIVQPSIKEKGPPKLPPQPSPKPNDSNGTNQDVEKLLGQLLEESGNINIITSGAPNVTSKNQRIHTIQLTPQKQEHLKNIQLQIQTLSASLTPGNSEIQAALKMLFAEQQKILATGKLLPPDKVYYHNNHLTIINPSSLNLGQQQQQKEQQPVGTRCEATTVNQVITSQAHRSEHSVQPNTTSQMAVGPRLAVPQVQQQQHKQPQQQQQQPQPPQQQSQPAPPPTPQQHSHSIAKKAHLIETQLNLDQSGAVKPDIHTPFRDKKDACIRLIRYHCMDQPVLSQKDLHKADEIFELTAEHFIAKYAKMVDKYKYLLMKESMRPVQTSELMMLDRMFLSEERQSLMRLRQEAEEAAQILDLPVLAEPSSSPHQTAEDYDEWACIQRELGCLPHDEPPAPPLRPPHSTAATPVVANAHAHLQPPKRTASSDSRLETLKRFRVDKHNKKTSTESVHNNSVLNNNNSSVQSVSSGINTHHGYEQQGQNDSYENEVENNSIDEQVQSAIDSILNLQQNTALDLDSILS
ncbi:putative uncharacterized protein DDB_G0271606 [Tribolium madens]|uniref:putative uncharacterized protein DDB_G0271606 n=1 Tax=Tribolium madens TaxID=41895 RepID=UPI001CF75F59|nr:putative uncharacterized protein DDB_G0271606 [Tribolium madens]XP_044260841.1 putative uncharacterized protein DDB_G0271606 [Tribolium madens]XP_044260842.1 putative uncharacterized protein DDB_G0271606 [Tribolium madens]